jgi:hypothetical protein
MLVAGAVYKTAEIFLEGSPELLGGMWHFSWLHRSNAARFRRIT